MRKSSLAHKVVDTKFSFLTYLVRIIKLMGAADLVAQSFVQNYSTFIIFHFYFQLPPVPPPPEELRQSRQHLAKVEPSVAAPLKFVFSKKATKINEVFIVNLTFAT